MEENEITPAPKMGAPRKEIDWDAFESLCQMHATLEEFCYFFKLTDDTLNARCQERYGETFSGVFKRLSIGGKMSLRREMWEGAMSKRDHKGNIVTKGNVTLQIFLSKQKEERGGLGFSDKMNSEIDIGDGSFERMMGMGKAFCDRMEKEKAEEEG